MTKFNEQRSALLQQIEKLHTLEIEKLQLHIDLMRADEALEILVQRVSIS